jgi:HAD superfamily hydrolase (TIGR01549 family)
MAAHAAHGLRGVFLDAGGTLVHLDRAFIAASLEDAGIPSADGYAAASEAARRRVLRALHEGTHNDDTSRWILYWETFLEAAGCRGEAARQVTERVLERHADGRLWLHVEEGTPRALERLRERGLLLVVVSNSDGRIARFLEHAGLLPLLDHVVDSGVEGIEKPDPAIFRIALERAGLAPHEVVHVGDIYEIDVAGARAAGIEGVLVGPPERYPDADCPRLPSVTALPQWLDARAAAPAAD